MNSLASGATLFGSATTIEDERNKKRSNAIMIILLEILASILNRRDTNSYLKHYLCDINTHLLYTLPKGQQRPVFFLFFLKSIKKQSICVWLSATTFSTNFTIHIFSSKGVIIVKSLPPILFQLDIQLVSLGERMMQLCILIFVK